MKKKTFNLIYIGSKNGILIEVNSNIYKFLKYSFNSNTKIQEIKEQLYEYTQFPPEIQSLVYLNKILENSKSLGDYNIKNKSSINLKLKSKNGIIILIKRFSGEIYPLDINLDSKILDIKKMIRKKQNLPLEIIIELKYNNKFLKDDSIQKYGIKHESIIEVYLDSNSGFVIFIKCLNGETITLADVEPDYTIEIIKEIVYYREGLLLDDNSRFLYGGKQLENNRTLRYYNIQKESSLLLCLRLRG